MCVNDMAVAYDGNTIYLISDGFLAKSTNAGISFSRIPLPAKCVLPLKNVAVAPDDKNVIAVSDSRCNGNSFFVSNNSGRSWVALRRPKAGSLNITDIAISALAAGTTRYYMVAIADNSPGNTTLGDILVRRSNVPYSLPWQSIAGVPGSHDYMAIHPSPNFASDYCACVVGATPSAGIDYQLINLNTNNIEHTVNIVPVGIKDFSSYYSRTGNSIVSADISLSPDFDGSNESTQIAFISIAGNNSSASDGVYRVIGTFAQGIGLNMSMRSVSFDGTVLLAGRYDTSRVIRSSSPLASTPVFSNVLPPRRWQWEAFVREAPGSNVNYLGTSGLNGGFSTF